MKGYMGLLHPRGKNALIAAIIFMLLATIVATACEPTDSSLQACPSAFKASCGATLYYTVPFLHNGSVALQINDHSGSAVRTFAIGAKDAGSYSQQWDGKNGAGSFVPEGPYQAVLTVANETDSVTQSCSMYVDNTAPVTTISFSLPPKADGSYEKGVTFSLAGSDSGSGISTYHYNLNNMGWQTWCSPMPLNDVGKATLLYKAIDCAGNYEIQTIVFNVTATATSTPVPTEPAVTEPTATPVPTPTPGPSATPKPTQVPEEKTFVVNPDSVQTHDDGRITYTTDDVTCTTGGKSLAGSVDINLTHAPSDAGLVVHLSAGLEATQASQFKLAITGTSGQIKDYAGVLVVDKQNLQNGADIVSATITMKVSKAWVDAHNGIGTVKILRYSDGVAESLDTWYVGMEGDQMVFRAYSPHGLSEFALASVEAPVVPEATAQPSAQPSGPSADIWVYAGVLAIIAALTGVVAYFALMKR